MDQKSDFYELLGISSDATSGEIRKAFHRLALIHHPDKNPEDSDSRERFNEINEAYQTLIDPDSRKRYDLFRGVPIVFEDALIENYLYAEVDLTEVKLNQEIALRYAYHGEGRFFKKPNLTGWLITSGPLVDYQIVFKNKAKLRETVLHYTIAPIKTGRLEIPPAIISFKHQPFLSNRILVTVESNDCFFCKKQQAGEHPYQIILFREQMTSKSVYRKAFIHQHIVLVPRSDLAWWYHRIGRTIKIGLALCGGALALVNEYSFIPGFLAGSLIAGLNVHLMYYLMGIKPLFLHAKEYPTVKDYLLDGFYSGSPDNGRFKMWKIWDLMKDLLS